MRSAAWRSVRADMSLTSLCRVGSAEAEAEGDVTGSDAVVWDDASGGRGGDDDDNDNNTVEVVIQQHQERYCLSCWELGDLFIHF